VPAERDLGGPSARGDVARIEISDGARWLHALDAQGNIVLHAPVTVGSWVAPSPEGDLKVEGVHPDPWWHYKPAELTGVPDSEPSAELPPGPNSPVGVVWIALSKEGYGIHGTDAPDTIGYTSSHGCIRLTNWDAETLEPLVRPGTPVHFVDLGAEPAAGSPQGAPKPRPEGGVEGAPKPRPTPG
jgi:lipoprotein-anchoring transpeptidase ErfK/SrfK